MWSSSVTPCPLSPKAAGRGYGPSIAVLLSLQFLLCILSQGSDDADVEVSRTQEPCGVDCGSGVLLRGAEHLLVLKSFLADGDLASNFMALANVLDESVSSVHFLA